MAKPNARILDGGIIHPSQEDPSLWVGEYLELTPANERLIEIYGETAGAPTHFSDAPVTDYFTLVEALSAICDKLKKARDDIKDLDDRVKALEQA